MAHIAWPGVGGACVGWPGLPDREGNSLKENEQKKKEGDDVSFVPVMNDMCGVKQFIIAFFQAAANHRIDVKQREINSR